MSRQPHRPSRASDLWVCHLGTVGYRDGVALQERLRARRIAGALPDTLLLLEHPPVYTRGRRAGAEDLPFSEDFYRAKGIEVIDSDRGGKLTYHGPGQLVGYPIMALDDVGRYLRTMESAIVEALARWDVQARSRTADGVDYTGVWVGDRKIASIGVHVSRGIATHGFAVNVENDLEPFSWVVACGLPDVRMTSLAAELERPSTRPDDQVALAPAPGVRCVAKEIGYRFCLAHGRRQRLVSASRLDLGTTSSICAAPTGAELITHSPRPRSKVNARDAADAVLA
jgi:lipoyl(octanoyl) transferase